MNRRLTLFFIVFIAFSYSTCTITQEFHFNNDLSGSYKMSVDYLKATEKHPEIHWEKIVRDEKLDSFNQKIKQFDTLGVSNIQFDLIDTAKTFYMSYNFNKLELLNELLISQYLNSNKSLTREDLGDFKYFEKRNKNTLVYTELIVDSLAAKASNLSLIDYKYILEFSFDRKIEKVDNPNVKISNNRKTATLKTDLHNMYQPDFVRTIKFKFK